MPPSSLDKTIHNTKVQREKSRVFENKMLSGNKMLLIPLTSAWTHAALSLVKYILLECEGTSSLQYSSNIRKNTGPVRPPSLDLISWPEWKGMSPPCLFLFQALFKERYETMSVENQQACRLRFQKLRERLLVSIGSLHDATPKVLFYLRCSFGFSRWGEYHISSSLVMKGIGIKKCSRLSWNSQSVGLGKKRICLCECVSLGDIVYCIVLIHHVY